MKAPGPLKCSYNSTLFKIYHDSLYITNPMSFSCCNSKCRKKYSILINSFFSKFPKQKIRLICEIIKIILNFDYNVQKAHRYINTELKISCSKELIIKVFKEMRITILKYIMIEYESGKLGYFDENKYFSCDECNIVSIGNTSIWLLGIIDNETKNFRISPTIERDTSNLKAFITKHVERGNHIVTDGWNGYDFLDAPNSGYLRSRHIHGGGVFGYGRDSTSHIESI